MPDLTQSNIGFNFSYSKSGKVFIENLTVVPKNSVSISPIFLFCSFVS